MIYNFGAGPGMLPASVIERIKADLPDWHRGMSVMEISHRSVIFEKLIQNIKSTLRLLLAIPDNYEILFFQGGARAQFTMVPMNLLGPDLIANHVITGYWSKLAYQDACKYGRMDIVATSEPNFYLDIPEQNSWRLTKEAYYLHYTDNESIHGVEFPFIPDVPLPLVADMTSNILTRPVDVSKYAVIYASAQKNLGIAGLAIVIVNPAYLRSGLISTPLLYDYNIAIKHNSMLNTPPTFALYVTGLILEWLLEQGGVSAIEEKNTRKAKKLYDYIDSSYLYENKIEKTYRSRTNIPFTLKVRSLESNFLQEAESNGLIQLKGHKLVGGIRASLYNAMPEEGVDALIEFMKEFERSNIA
jgi:phosphoserine aminotransferase